ncbi:unnamed protein product [Phytophthora lilii]|uniref:Unnamed protein product n=1 Tax=Phytophthora lilii TaxID=2077276 RepID=A0A9W6U3X2_9STRA|nr:unnamed protein product [Phytophthora lilii]
MQVSTNEAAADSSTGIFWGPAARNASAGSSHLSGRKSVRTLLRTPPAVQLPRLTESASSRSLSFQTHPPPRDSAATSLLGVLYTLLRSIKGDMNNFMKSMRAMDPPADNTVHFVGQHGPRYYSPGVAAEDREFFAHEREVDADKKAALAAVCSLILGLQCMFDHSLRLHFPCRLHWHENDTALCSTSNSIPLTDGSKAVVASARTLSVGKTLKRPRRQQRPLALTAIGGRSSISCTFFRRKSRRKHDEKLVGTSASSDTSWISLTFDAAEFLEFTGPNGPGSRQSRRQMALIIKARYEAADRIMQLAAPLRLAISDEAVLLVLESGRGSTARCSIQRRAWYQHNMHHSVSSRRRKRLIYIRDTSPSSRLIAPRDCFSTLLSAKCLSSIPENSGVIADADASLETACPNASDIARLR